MLYGKRLILSTTKTRRRTDRGSEGVSPTGLGISLCTTTVGCPCISPLAYAAEHPRASRSGKKVCVPQGACC